MPRRHHHRCAVRVRQWNQKNNGRENSRTIHRKDAGINKIHANNINERLNGTIKDRAKTARGFKTKDPPPLKLFLAHYNLFRPHLGLGGKTPAESLKVVIKGPNRWLTAIQYAVLRYQ